jgi:hypothetical protein
MITDRVFDRRIPKTFDHITKYPARELRKFQRTVANVEKTTIDMPAHYQTFYDQGTEGACVGFGESICMSLYNDLLFDAFWLYREAQIIDEWPETPPEEGTSLAAGFDVLRDKGHRYFRGGTSYPPKIKHGIVGVNRWTQTTDEDRTAIAEKHPIVDGVWWYEGFNASRLLEREVRLRNGRRVKEYWIPPTSKWGRRLGGHCICRPLASDQRQAFGWLNSWGKEYPWPVWIGYDERAQIQREQGESAIVTDR